MYEPRYRSKNNGVPILSKKEIESIADGFVQDFQPSALFNAEPLDVEAFVECYLGMTPDYQYLSHNGIYLGMTVFNDTDKVPVYDPQANRAEYISAKAGTVIIDRRLIENENQEHRYRFTLGHEGGHAIFHERFFYRDPNQLSFLEPNRDPMIQCRTDAGMNTKRTDPKNWTDKERKEWQANALSSALLMPRSAVRKLFEEMSHEFDTRYACIAATVNQMVERFNVSTEAAVYRLKELSLIQQEETGMFMPGSPFLDFAVLM